MKKIVKSFIYAFNGLKYALKTQLNFCVQIAIFIMGIVAAIYFNITKLEWLFFLFSSGNVLALELINTAFEAVVDLTTQEYSELAKKAKDVAAGAVLVISLVSAIIGIIIFLPYFMELVWG
jgi:diacylglycerol kinase